MLHSIFATAAVRMTSNILEGGDVAMGIHLGMSTLLQAVEACGIVAFACSGFIEARRKRMDLVGVFTVAFITAFGGGTLRDILLDKRPLFCVIHQEYPILIFVLALVASPAIRTLRQILSERPLVTAEPAGLGLCPVA